MVTFSYSKGQRRLLGLISPETLTVLTGIGLAHLGWGACVGVTEAQCQAPVAPFPGHDKQCSGWLGSQGSPGFTAQSSDLTRPSRRERSPTRTPLASGSTVMISLLLPLPADVTATTQTLYWRFRLRLGIL